RDCAFAELWQVVEVHDAVLAQRGECRLADPRDLERIDRRAGQLIVNPLPSRELLLAGDETVIGTLQCRALALELRELGGEAAARHRGRPELEPVDGGEHDQHERGGGDAGERDPHQPALASWCSAARSSSTSTARSSSRLMRFSAASTWIRSAASSFF